MSHIYCIDYEPVPWYDEPTDVDRDYYEDYERYDWAADCEEEVEQEPEPPTCAQQVLYIKTALAHIEVAPSISVRLPRVLTLFQYLEAYCLDGVLRNLRFREITLAKISEFRKSVWVRLFCVELLPIFERLETALTAPTQKS